MNRRDFVKWTTLMGAASAFPGWSRYALAESRPPLPIPALLEPDVRGSISLTLQRGQSQFLPGISTDTWGVNGNLLGPALRIRRGRRSASPSITDWTSPAPFTGTGWTLPVTLMAARRRLSSQGKIAK